MANSSSPEERSRVLGWLTHGGELAYALKDAQAKHTDVIWTLLSEAVEVIDKTPDQERSWLSSGARSGGWNMIGMTRADLLEIERIRLLCAMKPYDGETKYAPQRNDFDRALGVLSWMRWCNAARQPQRLIQAAIVLARTGDHDAVHRIYRPTGKPHRQTVHEIRIRTAGFILGGLRTDFNIIPSEGISFKEIYQ